MTILEKTMNPVQAPSNLKPIIQPTFSVKRDVEMFKDLEARGSTIVGPPIEASTTAAKPIIAPTFDGFAIGYKFKSEIIESVICSDQIFHRTHWPEFMVSNGLPEIGCCLTQAPCVTAVAKPTTCLPWASMAEARYRGGFAW